MAFRLVAEAPPGGPTVQVGDQVGLRLLGPLVVIADDSLEPVPGPFLPESSREGGDNRNLTGKGSMDGAAVGDPH